MADGCSSSFSKQESDSNESFGVTSLNGFLTIRHKKTCWFIKSVSIDMSITDLKLLHFITSLFTLLDLHFFHYPCLLLLEYLECNSFHWKLEHHGQSSHILMFMTMVTQKTMRFSNPDPSGYFRCVGYLNWCSSSVAKSAVVVFGDTKGLANQSFPFPLPFLSWPSYPRIKQMCQAFKFENKYFAIKLKTLQLFFLPLWLSSNHSGTKTGLLFLQVRFQLR